MKIEEGMYVRTKKGEISKIKWITFQRWEGINTVEATFNLENGEILMYPNDKFKASYNIIDLIEEGDYVNDYKILEIVKGFKVIVDKLELNTRDGNYYLKQFTNNEIKSIVTKEQYENNVYKVEDK